MTVQMCSRPSRAAHGQAPGSQAWNSQASQPQSRALASTPDVYLKHLDSGHGIPIVSKSGVLLMWADEPVVRSLIRDAKVRPMGTKRCVQKLEWIGRELKPIAQAEEVAGYKPSEFKQTKYSYDWETDDNPVNVWTLRYLANHTQPIFLAVAAACGGVRTIRRRKRAA